MKRRQVDLRSGQAPLLDLASYGRGGGSRTFTKLQLDLIARTVGRTPEVMVKVSGGARTLRGIAAHFGYISRETSLDMETDDASAIRGRDGLKSLVRDWDLDIEAIMPPRGFKKPSRGPKLVHNLIFSMPAGTPPDKVVKAVRKLAQEEWALKHRYAMVLHTDEPHPHVHVVLKARSEQGRRLNIRKATLRHWRQSFATNLRELGVAANATDRVMRGQTRVNVSDAVFRAKQRDALTRDSAFKDAKTVTPGATRQSVYLGWQEVAFKLVEAGHRDLAAKTQAFVESARWGRIEHERQNVKERARPSKESSAGPEPER